MTSHHFIASNSFSKVMVEIFVPNELENLTSYTIEAEIFTNICKAHVSWMVSYNYPPMGLAPQPIELRVSKTPHYCTVSNLSVHDINSGKRFYFKPSAAQNEQRECENNTMMIADDKTVYSINFPTNGTNQRKNIEIEFNMTFFATIQDDITYLFNIPLNPVRKGKVRFTILQSGGIKKASCLNNVSLECANGVSILSSNKIDPLRVFMKEPIKPATLYQKIVNGETWGVMQFKPNFDLSNAPPQTEIILVIDCSGSMSGDSISEALKMLKIFLKSIPFGTYFNMIRFGSTFETMFDQPVPYTRENFDEAMLNAEQMRADLGGTSLHQPLSFIMEPQITTGCSRSVFVITDGCVDNSIECMQIAKANAETTRIYTVGIGRGIDEHFLNGIAKETSGKACFIKSAKEMASTVMSLLRDALNQHSFTNFASNVPFITDESQMRVGKEKIFIFRGTEEHIILDSFCGDTKYTVDADAIKCEDYPCDDFVASMFLNNGHMREADEIAFATATGIQSTHAQLCTFISDEDRMIQLNNSMIVAPINNDDQNNHRYPGYRPQQMHLHHEKKVGEMRVSKFRFRGDYRSTVTRGWGSRRAANQRQGREHGQQRLTNVPKILVGPNANPPPDFVLPYIAVVPTVEQPKFIRRLEAGETYSLPLLFELQDFDGFWPSMEDITTLAEKPLVVDERVPVIARPTICALALIEKREGGKEDTWYLIKDKAMCWLRDTIGLDFPIEEAIKSLKDQL